jgi:hypothetical protein
MARAKPQIDESEESTPRQTRSKPDRVELHMTVSHGLEVRLTLQAKLQKIARNVLAEKLLDQALSRYGSDKIIRSTFDGSDLQAETAA